MFRSLTKREVWRLCNQICWITSGIFINLANDPKKQFEKQTLTEHWISLNFCSMIQWKKDRKNQVNLTILAECRPGSSCITENKPKLIKKKGRGYLQVQYLWTRNTSQVPANKEHLTGTVPVNKEHPTGTLTTIAKMQQLKNMSNTHVFILYYIFDQLLCLCDIKTFLSMPWPVSPAIVMIQMLPPDW